MTNYQQFKNNIVISYIQYGGELKDTFAHRFIIVASDRNSADFIEQRGFFFEDEYLQARRDIENGMSFWEMWTKEYSTND